MSRVNFGVELGFDIYDENGLIKAAQIVGSAVPGGDTGPQDAAPISSIYHRNNGEFYVKTANAGVAADWKLVPVQLSAGYLAANGTVAIGDSFEEAIEFIVGNQDDIQSASGIAQGAVDYGTFTGAILPDTSDNKALHQAMETAVEEIDANVDDLITLSGVAENATDLGTFTGATIPDTSTNKAALQSLETAHEEVDQNVNDLITLSGVAENATDLGTFTGSTIPDTSTNKAALQSLETALELLEGGFAASGSGVTTITVVDSLLVDDVHSIEWELVAWEEATPANKIFQKISALHNGTAAADATVADESAHTKLKVGANFNVVASVDLNGATTAQVMRLSLTSSTAGIAYEIRRTGVLVNS